MARTARLSDAVAADVAEASQLAADAEMARLRSELATTKARYKANPLDDAALQAAYRVVGIEMGKLTEAALAGSGLSAKDVARSKNYFALGLMYWLYNRPVDPQRRSIERKFAKKPELAAANQRVFEAGYAYGETAELFRVRYDVPPSKLAPGTYRTVTGNFAAAPPGAGVWATMSPRSRRPGAAQPGEDGWIGAPAGTSTS